jgi:hypothetical protein
MPDMALTPLDFPAAPTVGQVYPSPAVTGQPTYKWDGTDWLSTFALGIDASEMYGNFITGLILSTAGGSPIFGISAGKATNSTSVMAMTLPVNYTKTTSAWALGSNAGGLDTGIIANSTWYHVYVIKRSDTGVVDIVYSLSANAPSLPSGYNYYRRLGALKTNASGQWIKFIQDGDTFTWDIPPADIIVGNPGTASIVRTLSTPNGLRVEAIVMLGFGAPAAADNPAAIYLSDLSITDQAPNVGTGTLYVYSAAGTITNASLVTRVFTNTASQIRSRLQFSGAGTQVYYTTYGWVDRRGRDT